MKTELILIAVVLLIFFILCFAGCTVTFKAKDLEFESEQTRIFEIESFSFLCYDKPQMLINHEPILSQNHHRFFAENR